MADKITAAQRQQQQLALQQQQQLAMQQAQLAQGGTPGLVSPYDGTTPMGMQPTMGGYPIEAGMQPASLAGLNGGRPQVNATNQSALAPNGDVNQAVTNENRYENKYYNIVTMPQAGMYGGTGWAGGSAYGSNCYVDPRTGVMYCQREGGFTGWLKRLFRGY
jgi:hypothetical protein